MPLNKQIIQGVFYVKFKFIVNMSVKERLTEYLKSKKISKSAFGRDIGVSSAYIASIRKSIQPDKLQRIALKYPDLNTEWLLTGEGKMLKSESSPKPHSGANIPFYDIDVTASITEAFCDTPEIPQYYINFPPLNDCTAAFPVYGESMEPDFYAGEVVLVKEVTNVDSMLWGEPYLVITNANCDNLRTIKNVYLSDDRQKFILRATNPRYAGDTIVPRNDVLKIFLVKGKVNRRQL